MDILWGQMLCKTLGVILNFLCFFLGQQYIKLTKNLNKVYLLIKEIQKKMTMSKENASPVNPKKAKDP